MIGFALRASRLKSRPEWNSGTALQLVLLAALALAACRAPALPAQPPVPSPVRSPPGAPCPFEENCACPVPGVTIRWIAAYCMFLHETDDELHEDVTRCMATAHPDARALPPCEQNARWKRELCALTAGQRPVDECVADPAFLPYPVPGGAGG